MSRTTERQRAVALKAADARALIKSHLPFTLQQMSAAQVDLVQRVLDSYVVNPAVKKEADELYRKSIQGQSGSVVARDPDIVRRGDKVMEDYIEIKESDKNVRLDFAKLLTPDALNPTSDNPDEAAYLIKVKQTLASKGVWLRIERKPVPNPNNPSSTMLDERTFDVWLTLGPDGDSFKTQTGRLDRDALFANDSLGAGYYTEVVHGKVQEALHKAINRVRYFIGNGETLHSMIAQDRIRAFPGVVPISDAVGGAHYPNQSIWNPPEDVLNVALSQNSRGNVKAPSKTIVLASIMTQIAAEDLSDYIEATGVGARRVVQVLTVVDKVAKIVGVVLVVYGAIGGLMRLLATEATATATGEGAAKVATTG